ncbi:MAG: ABC transporter ATP-binding protein [Deltaproteobacteria bacterium]|nr:MAG: ABC transporter ATP-binding protein [Deltaproteobacteria bacterium]
MIDPDLLLDMQDLTIRTPSRVLVDGVSIQVRSGRCVAVIGHSGSGKSLSARAAMGVIDVFPGLVRGSLRYPAYTGEKDWFASVRLGVVSSQRALLRDTRALRGGYMTYSPQSASSALNPGRTLGRQLQIAIGRRERPPEDLGLEIKGILEEVGLPPRAAASLPGELSGGMAQRAALAIAIAPNPPLLIADEPETGLDPVLRRVVTELMINVAKKTKVALMLISHNMETVERVADDVVRLQIPTVSHDSLGREREPDPRLLPFLAPAASPSHHATEPGSASTPHPPPTPEQAELPQEEA